MRLEMNWANVSLGTILLCLAAVFAVAWCFIDKRRIAAEENRQRRHFENEMATAELPAWNGDTFEWTPESLAYLSGPDACEEPEPTVAFEPVPASEISGPMPVMGAPVEDDADDFLVKLKADNAAFLAHLDVP